MTKLILLLSLSLISLANAAECYEYEVKGIVRESAKDIILVVNEGTMSEHKLKIKVDDIPRIAPYFNSTSLGTYVLRNKAKKNDTIESIKSVKRSLPNPLNHMEHSFIKLIGKVKC